MSIAAMRPALLVFASMDPRGNKIGGIETHIRHILRNHPDDVDLILAGIDEYGDLPIGKPCAVTFGGRSITFLPLAHVPAEEARQSASRLLRSTTLRLVWGGLRHLPALRKLVLGRLASVDIPRVEFSVLPLMLRLPFVLTVHSDLAAAAKTDSLLKRYGVLKAWSERLAFRAAQQVFVVNAGIRDALVAADPTLASKCDVMTVPVDTRLFSATDFASRTSFRVVYAGRFDEVKDPALMFRTLAHLGTQLPVPLEFHYIGSADPEVFPEFDEIRGITHRHGPQDAEGVARIIADADCGVMTSHSEGMPCFLLETLASGRPFVAVDLPSFRPLVRSGISGTLVERRDNREETAAALAGALADVQAGIAARAFSPGRIAEEVKPYAVARVFGRLFALHASLRSGGDDPGLTATTNAVQT